MHPVGSWRSPLYLVTSLDEEVAGVWAAAAPLGMHSGKNGRHPSGTGGVDAAIVSRAGSNALSWLPGPSTTSRWCMQLFTLQNKEREGVDCVRCAGGWGSRVVSS